ncbi:MoaD/ThiS family protein [bacterium]|nr:MoaD/ThiS family protein [bacterium]
MPITVRVPTLLQKFTQNQAEVKAKAANINTLIDDLEKNFPGIKERICDETGKVRRFINIYVNGEDVRFLQQDETLLKEGDEVSIVPAIAGGQRTTENHR